MYTKRGEPVSIAKSKIDVIVTAVRYSADHQVELVHAYERRGDVWSDRVLRTRAELLKVLDDGKQMYAGSEKAAVGDFDLKAPIQRMESGAVVALLIEGESGAVDNLGVALF